MPENCQICLAHAPSAPVARSLLGRAAPTMSRPSRRNMPGGASLRAIRSRRSRYPSATPAARPDIPTGTAVLRSSSPGFPDSASESRYPTRPAARPPGAGGPSAAPDPWPVLSPHCRGTRRGPSRFVRPCAGLPAQRVGGKALIGPSSNSRRRRGARSRAPAPGTRHGARLAGRGTSQVSGHYSDG